MRRKGRVVVVYEYVTMSLLLLLYYCSYSCCYTTTVAIAVSTAMSAKWQRLGSKIRTGSTRRYILLDLLAELMAIHHILLSNVFLYT